MTCLTNLTKRLLAVVMTDHARIEVNPNVMMGKPVIRGSRITVEHLLRMFGAGHTEATILTAHPQLTVDDIRAAQNYAADSLGDWQAIAAE